MIAIGPDAHRRVRTANPGDRYPCLQTLHLPVSTNLVDETRRADAQPLAVLNPEHLPVAGDGKCDAGHLVVHEQPFPIRAERRASPF